MGKNYSDSRVLEFQEAAETLVSEYRHVLLGYNATAIVLFLREKIIQIAEIDTVSKSYCHHQMRPVSGLSIHSYLSLFSRNSIGDMTVMSHKKNNVYI